MQPHETWSSGGLTVTAIRSTDEGVGFLVSVDRLSILHARAEMSGDLPRTQVVAPARLGQTFDCQAGRLSAE